MYLHFRLLLLPMLQPTANRVTRVQPRPRNGQELGQLEVGQLEVGQIEVGQLDDSFTKELRRADSKAARTASEGQGWLSKYCF